MASEWRKDLDKFLQEHMLAVSSVFAIVSGFMIYVGIMGEWYSSSSLAPDLILDSIRLLLGNHRQEHELIRMHVVLYLWMYI